MLRGLFNKVSDLLKVWHTLDCIAADTNSLNIYSHLCIIQETKFLAKFIGEDCSTWGYKDQIIPRVEEFDKCIF